MFRRAAADAGRPDLRSHDLRHTGATLAAATGATLPDLMARLGHSSPRAALINQHATEKAMPESPKSCAASPATKAPRVPVPH